MEKVIIVSNRLPVTIVNQNDEITFSPSTGGLATGLNSALSNKDSLWIGWPGLFTSKKASKNKEIVKKLNEKGMAPVFLSKKQIDLFYEGFSNSTIWPLFHYFLKYTIFEDKQWKAYKEVNELFCEEVLKHADDNSIIWVHDYHLMLLPALLRKKLPNAKIGFFQHIPFPSYENFRILPTRDEIIRGILGADLIGFHTYDDVKHFLTAQNRIFGVDTKMGELRYEDRLVLVDAFPMGINYDQFVQAASSLEIQQEMDQYLQSTNGVKIILSIDRLDYSKGIPERLKSFELFLEKYPEYIEKVSLMMIVAPSREKVSMYKKLKTEIDQVVGNINAKYRTMTWSPIIYFYRSFAFDTLPAFYKIADVALITPLRDGMNLVCKEYIACRTDQSGVLILSEMAGASKELHDAIIINPYNIGKTAEAIKTALLMPLSEQTRRMKDMQHLIRKYNVTSWANLFLDKLNEVLQKQKEMSMNKITPVIIRKILDDFTKASQRILFLDYDGTLVPLQDKPEFARPDKELISIIETISLLPSTKLIIITGRDKNTMQEWLGHLELIDIVAEHGLWTKKNSEEWTLNSYVSGEWKENILPLLNLFVNRTPGAFIEEKDYSIAWHYRQADPDLGEFRSRELIDLLQYFTSNLKLSVLEGKKVIEIKSSQINKGSSVMEWIKDDTGFILAAGDDWTDEDMFKAMPESAYTIKIGFTPSFAKYKIINKGIDSTSEIRSLLKSLSEVHLIQGINDTAPKNQLDLIS